MHTDERHAHAYPIDLARAVHARGTTPPYPLEVLERLLSVCYQVSLLREEQRPVTFRLAVGDEALFSPSTGPPAGLQRLVFTRPRPFDEHELRRLAPAAPFHRALIGAGLDEGGELSVWGILHSGPRWLQSVRGGREVEQLIPSALMVAATGPGRLNVSEGLSTIAELSAGTLWSGAMDVFEASWLLPPAPGLASEAGDPAFGSTLRRHVLRRIVATIRGARHGGTLILLPAEVARAVVDERIITLKYAFRDEASRCRIPMLTARIAGAIETHRPAGSPPSMIGWGAYHASDDRTLALLDESMFEAAHMVASLAEVDGAVVMTDALELIGFGGEISGALAEVSTIARALDLEGARCVTERSDRVGTRHRSAHRLCEAIDDAIAVVVSQDGGVQFVRRREGAVTSWTQLATGPWEV